MKDQHKKIKGYRDLSQEEIDLMNEGKELAEKCNEYTQKLAHLSIAHSQQNGQFKFDMRWLDLGITDLQQGFMKIIRSIAQPTTF